MRKVKGGRWVALGLVLGGLGCAPDDTENGADPTCCSDVYPVWCRRFAECDPVTFSLSWRNAEACTTEQVPACQRGADADHICALRNEVQTDACVRVLEAAGCDDLFGSAGLPGECR